MFSRTLFFLLIIFPLFSANPAFAPESRIDTFKRGAIPERLEVPDGEYIPVPRELQPVSPSYRFSSQDFFFNQVNVNASGFNIVGDAANEPSIAVDPTDLDNVAIGWRQFNSINSSFRQAGWGYTADGGQSWTFPGVIEPGVFRSDPVLDFDSEGNFYYNSLTVLGDDFQCDVFKSTDGGATWDMGTFAQGGDKQWMAIDRSGGIGDGNIYAYWTVWYSVCLPGYFTRSTDGGASYEDCDSIPTIMYWGTLNVGPDGELYTCGAGWEDFIVAKSTNAQDSSQSVAWDLITAVDLDGEIWSGEGPNPGGLLGQTWVATDHSSGPNRGNVYLLCSVKRYSSPFDPLDVMFSRSTDGGATWSAPVRVNDDPGSSAWQWFGTMSVAPNGRIDAIWLDTRNDPGGYDSELYYSYSFDAGVTWSPNERLSDAFDPHVGWPQQNKMGDYFDMVSDNLGFHLAWAATFNGEEDVYYGRYHGHIPAVIYVPDDFTTIQAAIDTAVSGYQGIIVRPGTYHEHDIDFLGKAITLSSEDPEDSAVVASTIVDGDSLGSVFVFRSGEESSSVLTGFTITGGYAESGGGIYCTSSPTITKNIITGNSAEISGGGIAGGGLLSSPVVSDNTITGNSALLYGGGIICASPASMVISGNIIKDNTAAMEGGGIACYYNIPITDNLISGNTARSGGGIYCVADPSISNNVVVENTASAWGGGIYCVTGDPTLVNDVFLGNIAGSRGGGLYGEGSSPVAVNTIFWHNTAETGPEMYLEEVMSQPSVLTIRYSDVEGGQASVYVDSISTLDWGVGMVDTDPRFRDASSGDYHLAAVACGDSLDSPCIDAGDPVLVDSLLSCSRGLGTIISDMGAFGGGDSTQVGIGDDEIGFGIPKSLALAQNYPNPFNPSTTISFDIPGAAGTKQGASLTVYDLRGRRVRTLVDSELEPGTHKIHWDGRNDRGEPVASGIYLYRLRAGREICTRKMIALK